MGPILFNLQLVIFIFVVVVAAVTFFVRRKVGWGWLIVVWLGLSVLATAPYIVWVYRVSPLSLDETHMYAWKVACLVFTLFLMLSGMVVWLVALIVPPRTAPDDVPSTGPPGGPEDTHELLGIPRRYQALLAAHREARQRAVVRPWYRAMFRVYVPSYVRQDFNSTREFWRTPDVFMRAFVAAAPVLTALSEMPTAQLSALEAYHRVNLRRVRRRSAPSGSSLRPCSRSPWPLPGRYRVAPSPWRIWMLHGRRSSPSSHSHSIGAG
jgi:hypothetical protein